MNAFDLLLAWRAKYSQTLGERFVTKVELPEEGDCWNWVGAAHELGYGSFRVKGRNTQAYRYAYETLIGPVPEGLELDHLCRNPKCVNPEHLEPVTHRENVLRGETVPARHAVKTHCPQGHAYDQKNTYHYKGMRYCKTCLKINQAKHKEKYPERWKAWSKRYYRENREEIAKRRKAKRDAAKSTLSNRSDGAN